LKEGRLGRRLVEVKRLGIELGGERLDAFGGDGDRLRRAVRLSDGEILEVMAVGVPVHGQ